VWYLFQSVCVAAGVCLGVYLTLDIDDPGVKRAGSFFFGCLGALLAWIVTRAIGRPPNTESQ
jgi:hypothetical protein